MTAPSLDRALAAFQTGALSEAATICRQIPDDDPRYADVLQLLGVCAARLGDHDGAKANIRAAIDRGPPRLEYFVNLARLHEAANDSGAALAVLGEAVKVFPDQSAVHIEIGGRYQKKQDHEKVAKHYGRAVELGADSFEIFLALANAHALLGEFEMAASRYRDALARDADNPHALYNLGLVLFNSGHRQDAIGPLARLIAIDPGHVDAQVRIGLAYQAQGQFEAARTAFQAALSADPDHEEATAHLVFLSMQICDWPGLENHAAKLDQMTEAALADGRKPAETPFLSVVRCDDAVRNLRIARSWGIDLERRVRAFAADLVYNATEPHADRLKIGYLSADFGAHATAHLILRLFGLHDRERFEVFVYSYGPDDGSDYRKIIERTCDHFSDIRNLSPPAAAQLINSHKIDILIDLKGHTKDARLEICALRPAPVQLTYLGFPGSTGCAFFDYMVTDSIVSPIEEAGNFTEAPIYMPSCYQINDNQQYLPERVPDRHAYGLPDQGFVFSCFNQNYKIDVDIWDVWMRILAAVPGSVLWLFRSNDIAVRNLRRATDARGIDEKRLIFAPNVPKPDHLARLALADLFLDTRICNAHTTASDALWAGVPVLTCRGRHFSSRVASSLVAAVGLSELIVDDLGRYEQVAVALAADPARLKAIKQTLRTNRVNHALFDTPAFVSNLEAAYGEIWRRHCAGEPPRAVNVDHL